MNAEILPLPLALRDEEISENDFETLCRIAEDAEAQAGRLNRIPQRIPVIADGDV